MSLRKLLAAIMVASMLMGLVGTVAFAQADVQAEFNLATGLLKQFGIMVGDPDGEFRPLGELTRAESMKILVAAAGRSDDAALLAGAPAFKDSANHWASGYIALAKNAGWTAGFPDGTFQPEGKVTYAQLLTLLVRFVKVEPAAGNWPNNFITSAENIGIVDQSMNVRQFQDAPANRGAVAILTNRALSLPLFEGGKNAYQVYHDSTPPSVAVDAIKSPTTDLKVAVKGTATDAVGVIINGTAQGLGAGGAFSADVDLAVGANEIVITAVDIVGNQATSKIAVERVSTEAATIEAPATVDVVAGEAAAISLVVKDTNGAEILTPVVDATVDAALGTWDAATGTFTAATTAGSGTISWKSGDATAETTVTVTAGAVASISVSPSAVNLATGVAQKFTAKALDQYGNEVGAQVASWSTEAAKAIIDANGNFSATTAGTIKVTATVGDMTGEATVTAFGTASKLAIDPVTTLVANGKSQSTVTVKAQDAAGNTVTTYAGTVTLRVTTPGISGFPTAAGTVDQAVTSQAAVASNGVATFTLQATGATTGDNVASATATGLTGATATVTSEAQVVSSISVAADPSNLAADGSSLSAVTVTLLDQAGKKFIGASVGDYTATFTSSDTGVGTVPGTAVNFTANASTALGARAIANVTARNNIGSSTISVSVKKGAEEKFTGSTTISTILVGEPYKLMADAATDTSTRQVGGTEVMSVYFRLQDVNGNQVTKLNGFGTAGNTNPYLKLTLTANDDKYTAVYNAAGAQINATIPLAGVTIDATNGEVTAGKVRIRVASGKSQTVNFSLSGTYDTDGTLGALAATTLQSTNVDGKFVPGSAKTITLTVSPAAANAGGGGNSVTANGTLTLYGYIRDDANLNTAGTALTVKNQVTSGTYDVTFSRDAGTTFTWSGTQTVASSGGLATLQVAAGTSVGTDTFKASFKPDGTTTVNSANGFGRVGVIGAPYQLTFYSYPTVGSPAKAGVDHSVYVYVKDAQGTPETVTTDNSTVVTLTIKDSTSTVRWTGTATASKGLATFSVTGVTLADTYTATAESSGLVKATQAGYTVVAGPATKIIGTLASSTIAASADSTTTLTVRVADQYDNARVDALTNTDFTATSATTSVATMPSNPAPCVNSATSASCAYTITGTANAGTTTITVSKSGVSDYTATVTSTIVGDAKSATVVVDQGGTVGGTTASTILQRVRVRITDANGNRVTQTAKQEWVRLAISGTGADGSTPYIAALTPGVVVPTAFLYQSDKATTNGQLYRWAVTSGGEATFYVNSILAGTPTYTAILVTDSTLSNQNNTMTQKGNTTSGSATGNFAAATANKVIVTLSPTSVVGNGSSIAQVTAKVTDMYGNHKSVAGRFMFEVKVLGNRSTSYSFLQGAASDSTLTVTSGDGKYTAIVQAQTVSPGGPYTTTVHATFTPDDPSITLAGGATGVATLTITSP